MDIRNASSIILDKLEGWIQKLVAMLPNLALAVIIIVLFWLVARYIRKFTEKVFSKFSHHQTLKSLVTNIIYLIVLFIGLFIALNVLNLDQTVTSLLAGAGIIGLALGFAFQDIAANFMSGVIMAIRAPFREGDIIETQDKTGTVVHMELRATTLRSFQGQYYIIPNKDIFQNPITNYSRYGKRRIDLPVGISYGDDLGKVKSVTLETISSLEDISKSDPIQFFFTEFGDSSINFEVRFWVDFKVQPDFLEARSNAIIAIKEAFESNDIMIPFPIRTLDFGIKGGQTLTEAWPGNLSDS